METVIDEVKCTIVRGSNIRATFVNLWNTAGAIVDSGKACDIYLKPVKITRSVSQNRLMWALLQDIANQVIWHGLKLTSDEWKEIITASWRGQRTVPNLEGTGFVVLGARTSKLSVDEMGELINVIIAFGHEQEVKFTAPKWMYEGI
ncbi:recombination protein NinB [Neisseria sp. Ec49-e6-T10]|uniref:recombination protein NinB n=1 Tax=Neisseria sp. Ec49-e6-T10 TaxID=3140744 RepID=UPI003EB7C2A3